MQRSAKTYLQLHFDTLGIGEDVVVVVVRQIPKVVVDKIGDLKAHRACQIVTVVSCLCECARL